MAIYPAIGERAQQLLKSLIERYIQSGEPVGSRTLSRDTRLDLSPATIRNVMADLEEMGFVKAPHTSAGRIPTEQGYRCFIDSLVTVQPLDQSEISVMQRQLPQDIGRSELVEKASAMLSGLTRMAGLVTLPRPEHNALRHVEFLPLSDNRILVVLVIDDTEIQNRVIHTDRPCSREQLQQAANYFNEHYAGLSLSLVKEALVRDLRQTRENADRIMTAACEMAVKALDARDDAGLVVAGQTNLMHYGEMADVDRLRQLFEAFNQQRELIALLDQVMNAQGVQIFIGKESGYQALDECSVVTAPYSVNGEVIGVLGVVGPTRMAYQRVIPMVDVTAKLLSAALNQE